MAKKVIPDLAWLMTSSIKDIGEALLGSSFDGAFVIVIITPGLVLSFRVLTAVWSALGESEL